MADLQIQFWCITMPVFFVSDNNYDTNNHRITHECKTTLFQLFFCIITQNNIFFLINLHPNDVCFTLVSFHSFGRINYFYKNTRCNITIFIIIIIKVRIILSRPMYMKSKLSVSIPPKTPRKDNYDAFIKYCILLYLLKTVFRHKTQVQLKLFHILTRQILFTREYF